MVQDLTDRVAWMISTIGRLPTDLRQIAAPVLRSCLMEKIDEVCRNVNEKAKTKQAEARLFFPGDTLWVLGLTQNIQPISVITLPAAYSLRKQIAEYMLANGGYCLSLDDFQKLVLRISLKVSSGEYDKRLMESEFKLLLDEMRSTVFSLIGRTDV